MADNIVVNISNDNWQNEIINSKVPVLIDFWAEWCSPCLAIAPILKELAAEHEGEIKVAKVDVDHNQELAQQFHVQSIPTLLILKAGIVQEQMVGAMSKSSLQAKLSAYL